MNIPIFQMSQVIPDKVGICEFVIEKSLDLKVVIIKLCKSGCDLRKIEFYFI